MMMALLKSTNETGIDFLEYRDQLYYNKFLYRVRFELKGSRYTWYSNTPQELYDNLYDRNQYVGKASIIEARKNKGTLEKYIEWRNLHKPNKTIIVRIEHNTVSIFSNDLPLLKTIETIDSKIDYAYTKAVANQLLDTKYFIKDPEYKYRIYLKSKRIDKDFVDNLASALNNSKNLHPSKALQNWLLDARISPMVWKYHFSHASHFIDYNDESMLSYLFLMVSGGYFGRKFKLEKRPVTV